MGALDSFISTQFALQLDLEHVKVETNCRIKLPNDFIVDCFILYKHVPISIGESIFFEDLIEFDLLDFDITLRINWLRSYGAKIDCKDLKVILNDEKGEEVCFYGEEKRDLAP